VLDDGEEGETMTVEQHGPLPASNYTVGRDGNAIDRIVLHTTVGWAAAAEARFKNPTAQVSAHFLVRIDGSLWQFVDVWNAAYHAGDYGINLRSIGIENEDGGDFNGVRPDALYIRSAALVAQFCKEYSIPCVRGTGGPGIYDHRQVHATGCPDALDTDRIIREAAAIVAAPPPAPAPPPPAPPPSIDVTVLRPPSAPDALHEWAAIYKLEAPKAGIRAEVALAQALHETGNFTYPGTAKPFWNNPAGLGVTGAADIGNRFATKHDGVIAHLQHLLMYFAAAHTPYCAPPNVIDQRHFAHRGLADDIHKLDGAWAVPGVGYGDAILKLVPAAQSLLA
jgi:hypothetical protein